LDAFRHTPPIWLLSGAAVLVLVFAILFGRLAPVLGRRGASSETARPASS
jgi:hypothetical protein